MMDNKKIFSEIAFLLRERQKKEAEIKDLERQIFDLLGVESEQIRKRKPLSASAMRSACGL